MHKKRRIFRQHYIISLTTAVSCNCTWASYCRISMYLKLVTIFRDVYKYSISLCDLKLLVFSLKWQVYCYFVLDWVCNCNYVTLTNKMHTFFKFNILIQFFASSICFESHVFIIKKTILYVQFLYGICLNRAFPLCYITEHFLPPVRLLT